MAMTTKIEAVHPLGYVLTHPDGNKTTYQDFNEAFLKYVDFYGWPDGPFLVKENNQYQVRGPKGGFMKLCSTEEEALATAERIVIHDNTKPGRPPMSFNRPQGTHRFIDTDGRIIDVVPEYGESPLQAAANQIGGKFMEAFKENLAMGMKVPADMLVTTSDHTTINPAGEVPITSSTTQKRKPTPIEEVGQAIKMLVAQKQPDNVLAERSMDMLLPMIDVSRIARAKSLEELAQAMFVKMGGMPHQDSIETLIDYVHTQGEVIQTRRLMTQLDEMEPGNRENFMEEMIGELEDVAGVTGLQPLINDYPHSASMIIKLDMKNLSEESAGESLLAINQIINQMKPKGLDKFEIIYHTKEVY